MAGVVLTTLRHAQSWGVTQSVLAQAATNNPTCSNVYRCLRIMVYQTLQYHIILQSFGFLVYDLSAYDYSPKKQKPVSSNHSNNWHQHINVFTVSPVILFSMLLLRGVSCHGSGRRDFGAHPNSYSISTW